MSGGLATDAHAGAMVRVTAPAFCEIGEGTTATDAAAFLQVAETSARRVKPAMGATG